MAGAADALLSDEEHGQIDYRLGVIDNQNPDKALAHVAFDAESGVVLPYRRFSGINEVPVGKIVKVGFSGDERHAVRWHGCDLTAIDGFVKEMTGNLTRPDGQAFGFVMTSAGERVFVNPVLIDQTLPDGDRTRTCVAMLGMDKKGKRGWRALCWSREVASPENVI